MKSKILVLLLCISVLSTKIYTTSCDPSNLLLQPGGLYSLWFKGCYEYDNINERLYLRKHWQTQMLVYGCEASNGFNNQHHQCPLSSIVFGQDDFHIRDIFLASKLACDNKLFLPGMMPDFGATKDEQYIALLAPTKVNIQTKKNEFGFNASSIYLFKLPKTCCAIGALGFQLPIRHQRHRMTLAFEGGNLFGAETVPMGQILEENTLKQFFRDFQSIEDFFNRAILKPKGLTFLEHQQKTGVGDISLFGLVDLGLYFEHAEALQIGLNVIFPSGNKSTSSKLWEIELGNGGAYQFEPFVNIYLRCTRLLNPTVYAGVRISKDFTALRRIPKLVVTTNNAADIADLQVIVPARFEKHKVRAFSQFDSSVLQFADCAVPTTVSRGTEFIAHIGNYMYDIIQCGFFLGVFYDIHVKRKDSFKVIKIGKFNTKFIEEFTEKTEHKFSWSIAYAYTNKLEVYIGSQHVVAGKNVPQDHKIFASISWFI